MVTQSNVNMMANDIHNQLKQVGEFGFVVGDTKELKKRFSNKEYINLSKRELVICLQKALSMVFDICESEGVKLYDGTGMAKDLMTYTIYYGAEVLQKQIDELKEEEKIPSNLKLISMCEAIAV